MIGVRKVSFLLVICGTLFSCKIYNQPIIQIESGMLSLSTFCKTTGRTENILSGLIEEAKRRNVDILIDSSIVVTETCIIKNCENLTIRFVNGARIFQDGISIEEGADNDTYFDVFRIENSRNIKLLDPFIEGNNPSGNILGLGREASAIHVESSGFDKAGAPYTSNIHIVRPIIKNIVGTGIRSFSGQRAQGVFISNGIFNGMAKAGINCNAEGIVIKNCEFEYCKIGMEIANSSHAIIDGNKLSYCAVTGIAIGGHTKRTRTSHGVVSNDLEEMKHSGSGRQIAIKVVNNTVYKCGGGLKANQSNGPGISVAIGTTHAIVSNNHIYFSGRSGIQVADSHFPENPILYPILRGNVLVSNGHKSHRGPSSGIYLDCPAIVSDNFISVGNNTRVDGFRQKFGIYVVKPKNFIKIRNFDFNALLIYNNIIEMSDEGTAIFLERVDGEFLSKNKILIHNNVANGNKY